jgi:hypothetical protein
MKKRWKWILGAPLAAFALLQLTSPSRTNPPVQRDFVAAVHPPAAVAASLRAACYDCHSHETVWPWYARIAPVSWLVVSDVNEGRRHLDFSDWPTNSTRATRLFDRINEVLDYREMPPAKYTLMHPAARLTDARRKELLDWTDTQVEKWRATDTHE